MTFADEIKKISIQAEKDRMKAAAEELNREKKRRKDFIRNLKEEEFSVEEVLEKIKEAATNNKTNAYFEIYSVQDSSSAFWSEEIIDWVRQILLDNGFEKDKISIFRDAVRYSDDTQPFATCHLVVHW